MIDRLLKWLEWPIQAMLWISLAAGFLMMLHVTVDVSGRALLNRPLVGTTEIVAAWYMVALAYLPWAWVAKNDMHIVADMFTRIGSRRFGFWLEIGVKLLTAVYVGVFAWQTCLRAIQQTQRGESWEAAGGFIPVWPSRWMLPLAGGLMMLYLILRIVSDIRRGPGGGSA